MEREGLMVIILLCSVLTIERMLYRKFKRIQLFRKGKKIVGKKRKYHRSSHAKPHELITGLHKNMVMTCMAVHVTMYFVMYLT